MSNNQSKNASKTNPKPQPKPQPKAQQQAVKQRAFVNTSGTARFTENESKHTVTITTNIPIKRK